MSAPGLPSLNESRAVRRRQLAMGRAVIGGIPPRLFLSGLALIVVGGFVYFRNAQAELEQQRGRVMAKQRAVAAELGPRLLPMRDRLEQGARELAQSDGSAHRIQADVPWAKLFASPGMYFRARLSSARTTEQLRLAARESLRDGFTSCLIRDDRAPLPRAGASCRESSECNSGELCSEYRVCQRPTSPFNARLLYRALGVLSDTWTEEVRSASTDLALVVYERGLDSVTRVDIPVAIDVYQRSKYVVVVLDEDPKAGLPPPLGSRLEGTLETELARVQRSPHRARVGVWSLPSGQLLAELTGQAAGELREVGQKVARSREASAARERQANSCALALDVQAQLLARQ